MFRILFSFLATCCSVMIHAQKGIAYTDNEIINMYSSVGEIHNKGLESAFNSLQQNYGTKYQGGLSKQDRDNMYRILDANNFAFVTKEIAVNSIDLTQMVNRDVEVRDYMYKDLVSQFLSSKEGQNLSPEILNAFNELNSLMDDDSRCFNKSEYDRIVQDNIQNLQSFNEKVLLVCGFNIAYNSIQYWNENLVKWQAFFSYSLTRKPTIPPKSPRPINQYSIQAFRFTSPGRNIAKADVSGIVWGGTAGCITGAIGGSVTLPGVGTLTGCAGMGAAGAVTAGIGGSLKAAVNALLDWLF
ncbi:MAG: hypothetical protein ACJ75F_04445 [Flavisolibacter sp.]